MTSHPIPTHIAKRAKKLRAKKGLGRLHAPDPRDKNFPLRAITAPVPVTTRYWPMMAGVLDQGDTSECVAFAWTGFLLAAPVTHRTGVLGVIKTFADSLYHRAQLVDEWPGEDYDGTSVRAGAKVLQADARLTEYRWAFDAVTARDFVLSRGPLVIGVNWYEHFFVPDAKGFLVPEGETVGGHALLVLGYSQPRNSFRIQNSWGKGWGDKGRAWISYDVFQRLLAEDGECCSAVEVKPPTEK